MSDNHPARQDLSFRLSNPSLPECFPSQKLHAQLQQAQRALELAQEERREAVLTSVRARTMEQQMVNDVALLLESTSNGRDFFGLERSASVASQSQPIPADSIVATWLEEVGEGYAEKFFHVFKESGYEQQQDFDGMTNSEVLHVLGLLEQQGGAKAPHLRRMRAALEIFCRTDDRGGAFGGGN